MNAKKEILLKQKNELTMYQNELNECNNISQKMIKDISLDSQKRKMKILINTQNVLNKNDAPNIDEYRIINSDIKVVIDANKAVTELLKVGNIEQDNIVVAPVNIAVVEQKTDVTQLIPRRAVTNCGIYAISCVNKRGYISRVSTSSQLESNHRKEKSLFEFIECDAKENKWYIRYKGKDEYENYWVSYSGWAVCLYKAVKDRA
eukprot:213712_1